MNKPESLIFKSSFQSVDELIHFDLVKNNLANLKISDNYSEAGNLRIISANECVFYEAEVVNFTNTRNKKTVSSNVFFIVIFHFLINENSN